MARHSLHEGRSTHRSGTIGDMKKLLAILAIVAIGAVVYKVLTTEVPIDEI
jgi:hypothetical protein